MKDSVHFDLEEIESSEHLSSLAELIKDEAREHWRSAVPSWTDT